MVKNKQFAVFNDGTCSFHEIDDDGNAGSVKAAIRYQERTIGYKRFIESMTAKVQVDRLIRIPAQPWLTTEYLAVIGEEVFEIKQVQKISDTLPKTNDISLHLTRKRRFFGG